MCFSRATKRCTSRCLKFFSVVLFLVSVAMIVLSAQLFKPMQNKLEAGKLKTHYTMEGNIIAAKAMKFGGVLGVFMSILAFLTAAKKVPYFAMPFSIGSFILGGVFCAVFVTTISADTALYYKQ